ncbi:MAG: phosphoribosyltransferase [Candidatus Bathyarchaeia archaeon]|jgi:predicted phosphoribosyltransferase
MAFFGDRIDAGKRLAAALSDFAGRNGVVLAIPRGGVVVGYQIAEALDLPLDVIIPRKLGAPGNPELAIGAIAEDGTAVLDDELIRYLGVGRQYIYEEGERQKAEIGRRLKVYREGMPPQNLKGKEVIVVDDGIATGSTMKAALASVKNRGAASVTVAVPVGPPSTIEELKRRADHVVCLYTPEYFEAIGQFYANFSQTSDGEVITLLRMRREAQPKGVTTA